MNDFGHGGNIHQVQARLKRRVIDFSASINPLGCPPAVKPALKNALDAVVHYPDCRAEPLVEALAAWQRVDARNILAAAGSIELIYLVTRAFACRRVTIVVPAFSEYERAARSAGSRINFVYLKKTDDFCLDLSRLPPEVRQAPPADMLFLGNPNNPTANLLLDNRVKIEKLPFRKIVIDEAFMDFIDDEKRFSFIRAAQRSRKIIVLRTLTKIFALAGLRVGYAVASKDNIARLKRFQPPWSVSSLAQAAAGAAIKDRKFLAFSRKYLSGEKKFLREAFSRIDGLKAWPGQANFVLLQILDKRFDAASLRRKLLERGILVRDCANFRGLNKRFIRVAVSSRGNNQALVKAFGEFLCKNQRRS